MKETAKQFVEVATKLMERTYRDNAGMEDVKRMTSEDFESMQIGLQAFSALMELTIEQAKVIDEMNEKLDKLLKLLK